MITYVFSGQGSQRPGMGAGLFSAYPKMVQVADSVLGYSIEDLCLSGDRRLNQTEFTQPALFVVNALIYLDTIQRTGIRSNYLLGHSLGELNALHAAGVFSFEVGLRIVHRRGELMARFGKEGTMAALVGDRDRLLSFLERDCANVYLASDNSPRQVVVAGRHEAIAALDSNLRSCGIGTVIPLSVSGAFHSPLMQAAQEGFAEFLEAQSHNFQTPDTPAIANVSALPYLPGDICSHLTMLLTRPVQWINSIRYLLQRGPMLFNELGPRCILSTLIQQTILPTQ